MNLTLAKSLAGLVALGSGSYLIERHGTPAAAGITVVPAAAQAAGGDRSALTAATGGAAAAGAAGGCLSRSTRFPWGTLAPRTWTPLDPAPDKPTPAAAGTRTGAPFSARLVLAYGVDSEFSRRSAVFEFADGCRRQYRVDSFAPADVAYITGQIAAHPAAADPARYVTAVADENEVTPEQVAAGTVRTYETQHFNLMYGVDTDKFSYTYQAGRGVPWPEFLKAAGRTLEDGWVMSRDILGAPMPYATAATKKKINVYICGTGLPFIPDGDREDCGAAASKAVYVSAVYLQPGSTTLWHEFGHTIQFYSGGFRDRAEAGPVWETSAVFDEFALSPAHEAGIGWYYSNLENGPFWSTSRYGAYPIMSYLFENDALRPYLWSPWTGNLRDANGASREDFVQTLVRQGQAANVFPDGYRSFADAIGWYGARLATGDFLNQKTLLDVRVSPFVATLYAPLRRIRSGVYTAPAERPLLQWGTHIVPLTPSGTTLTARLRGTTRTATAAWRYAIVSLAADGTPRYSALGSAAGIVSGDTVSLPAVRGEKAFLVVTATPYAYEVLGWQDMGKPVSGQKYPYMVTIGGATPLEGAAAACNSVPPGEDGQNLNYNTNGYTDQPKPC